MAKCISRGFLARTLTPGVEKRRCDKSGDRREGFGAPAECALLEMRPKAMSDGEAMRYDTPVLHHSGSGLVQTEKCRCRPVNGVYAGRGVCVFAHMRPGIFLGDFQDGWSRWVARFGGKPWDDTGGVG